MHEIIYLVDEKYAAQLQAVRKKKEAPDVALAPPKGSMSSMKF